MPQKYASLSTRDRAKEIARQTEQLGRDTIDLQGVEFISRSFADEVVVQAELRELEIMTDSDDVEMMLSIVGYDE